MLINEATNLPNGNEAIAAFDLEMEMEALHVESLRLFMQSLESAEVLA